MSVTKKSRNANMDLLRIVSMLLIVFLHSIDHSGVLENAENCGTAMYFYVRFTYMLCQVCVNIYVMLSGYFLVTSKFRLKKLVTLWMEAVFYALTLRLVFMITGARPFSVVSLLSCFFPILTGRYWFITIYVGMYLIFPFLNVLIRAMDKKQHALLNICLFGIFSVWSSLHPSIAGMNSGGGWGLAWFAVLYLAAAWLRLYYEPKGKAGLWLAAYVMIPALVAAIQCARGGDIMPGIVMTVVDNWFRYDSAPVYIMTMGLFVGFLNLRIGSEKWANLIRFVAPLTFGVYLIHAHADVSPWSWEVLDMPAKMDSALFPVVQLGVVLGIFAVCAAIDAARKVTVGKLEELPVISRVCETVTGWVNSKFAAKEQ